MPFVPHKTGPQMTSKQALQFPVFPKLGDLQRAVYYELACYPDLTNQEIAKHLNLEINVVTPRVHELRREWLDQNTGSISPPLVVPAGKRICRITGHRVMAWRAVKIPTQLALL